MKYITIVFALLFIVLGKSLGLAQNPIPVNYGFTRDMPADFWGLNGTNTINDQHGWQESLLQNKLKTMDALSLRYPGGTVSNFWDWRSGYFLRYLPSEFSFESNHGVLSNQWHYNSAPWTNKPDNSLKKKRKMSIISEELQSMY